MKGLTKRIGRPRFRNWMFNDHQYKLLDSSEFMSELLSFSNKDSWFPRDHWELVIIIIFGGMQAGKSETMNQIADIGNSIYSDTEYGFDCFKTNDLEYALDNLNKDIPNRKKVEFIFFDDMMISGFDARESMSSDNIDMGQLLAVIRHRLANEDEYGNPDPRCKNGLCCATFAIQSPTRIDKFIRENAHLRIYKVHYDIIDKETTQENIDYIKDVTEDSMYRHIYIKRGAGLGITKTGKAMRMYFPQSKFKIPVKVPPNSLYNEFLEALMKLNFDELSKEEIKGYIEIYKEDHHLKINTKHVNAVLNKAYYLKGFQIASSTQEPIIPAKINNSLTNELKMSMIDKMRKKDISYRKIAEIFDVNHSTIFDEYKSWLKQQAKNRTVQT